MRHRHVTLLLLAALALGFAGVGFADLVAGEHVACVTVAATATTPEHTVGVDGNPVSTIPGASQTASGSACVTATDQTVTGPTTTETVHDTTTVTVTAPLPPPPPPPPAELPYSYNGFEGNLQTAITTAPYYISHNGSSTFDSKWWKVVTGASGLGQGLGLSVDSTCPGCGSTELGPSSFVGVHPADAHTSVRESTWYRVRFKLPGGGKFVNGTGQYQWIWEWHEQSACDGNSIAFGIINYHGTLNTNQLWFRPMGGPGNTPVSASWVLPYPSMPIVIDKWYDIVLNVVWDTKASDAGGIGAFNMWIDGIVAPLKKAVNTSDGDGAAWTNPQPFPTLYTDGCSGVPDHPSTGLYNYRKAPPAGQSSEIDFDDLYIGPTAASVGFAG